MGGIWRRAIPLLALAMLSPATVSAQTFFITGNDPNFDPYTAIPCNLGDGFVAKADTTSIKVWLVGNDAQNRGRLYFINPRTGQDRFLFENQDEDMEGVQIDLGKFPKGAPIVFKYVNESDPPKYSGLNEPGTYDFDADPLMAGFAINHRPKPVSPEINNFDDHRWAISGRVNAREVVFAFDDVARGDYDYNDVVFIVSGVALNSEVKLPKPVISGIGDFNPAVSVSIAAPSTLDPPAVLYYTVDGTDPRIDTARGTPLGTTRIYAGAFDVLDETAVIARVWKAPLTDSGGGVRTFLPSDTALMRFVPLRVAVASAVYLDESGDGRIDAVRIRFDAIPPRKPADLALQSPFPPGAVITLPQARIEASPLAAESAVFFARFADQPFPFGTGFADGPYGKFPTPSVLFGTAPFTIKDSAGPVIVKADALRDASNPAARLVRVVFSEAVAADLASKAFPFILKRSVGADPNGKMDIQEVRKVDERTYDYVFLPASAFYPIPGDSIKLVAHAALMDARGTRSNMSFYVPVGGDMETQIVAVTHAVYLDEDGNGHIDAARVTFSLRPPALPASIALQSPFPPGETVTLPQGRIEPTLDSAAFTVRFADQDFSFGTGFAEAPLGRFPPGAPIILHRPEAYVLQYPAGPFPIRDSAGPVIAKAEAMKDAASGQRIMRVTFSEPVLADQASKAFPFTVKRSAGADPNGRMAPAEVRKVDAGTYDYVFAADSPLYPVPGDSLKLQGSPALTDTPGTVSNMGYFVPVTGPADILNLDVAVKGGGWVIGSTLINPQVLRIPVGVIPGSVYVPNPACLECKDPKWKSQDPARPGTLPIGPLITVSAEAPFSFNLAFYTNLGAFVNRAQGDVTETMLQDAPVDSLGRKVVSLMWYPVSAKGHQAGTGAYVARGQLSIPPGARTGAQGEKIKVVGRTANLSVTVGYMRK